MRQDDGITETDLQARRILDLALAFTNAPNPLSSSELHRRYYPQVSKESFRKVFLRDREKLALCGLVIRRTNKQPDEPLWQVDPDASYALTGDLSEGEALALDVACAPLASEAGFPYADDLRMALSKIDRAFGPGHVARVSSQAKTRGRVAATAERCASLHHACHFVYQSKGDTQTQGLMTIYGFFFLRGNTYVVADLLSSQDASPADEIRTYRLDRFVSMRENARISYVIPPDFCITDYVLLPFQLGPSRYYATFAIPEDALRTIKEDASGYGTLSYSGGMWEWKVPVSSEEDAASWAIAEGIVPKSPPSLLSAWKSLLEKVAES